MIPELQLSSVTPILFFPKRAQTLGQTTVPINFWATFGKYAIIRKKMSLRQFPGYYRHSASNPGIVKIFLRLYIKSQIFKTLLAVSRVWRQLRSSTIADIYHLLHFFWLLHEIFNIHYLKYGEQSTPPPSSTLYWLECSSRIFSKIVSQIFKRFMAKWWAVFVKEAQFMTSVRVTQNLNYISHRKVVNMEIWNLPLYILVPFFLAY